MVNSESVNRPGFHLESRSGQILIAISLLSLSCLPPCPLTNPLCLLPQEMTMYDFECHYRTERWPTVRYFKFVEDFLMAAQFPDDSADCDPPPCPTAAQETTRPYATGEYVHTLLLALLLPSIYSFPPFIIVGCIYFHFFLVSDVLCFIFLTSFVFFISSHFGS